jgi:hypothetical protein
MDRVIQDHDRLALSVDANRPNHSLNVGCARISGLLLENADPDADPERGHLARLRSRCRLADTNPAVVESFPGRLRDECCFGSGLSVRTLRAALRMDGTSLGNFPQIWVGTGRPGDSSERRGQDCSIGRPPKSSVLSFEDFV